MTRPLSTSNSITYEQNYGGGAAFDVLLGPFGVGANMAAIKHRTEREAAELNGKPLIAPLPVAFGDRSLSASR